MKTYASRCALRVLPLTVGVDNFGYFNKNKNKRDLVAALNLSALGYDIPDDIIRAIHLASDSYNSSPVTAKAIASSTSIPGEKDNTYSLHLLLNPSDSNPRANKTENASLAAEMAAEGAARVSLNPVGNDIEIPEQLVVESYNDYQQLSGGKDLNGAALWQKAGKIPKAIREGMQKWENALIGLDLKPFAENYQKVLNGYPSPETLYDHLYEKWKLIPNLEGSVSIESETPNVPDSLGRYRLVDAITELLTQHKQKDPLTIGLLGYWGSGKTTVLHLLEKRLKEPESSVRYSIKHFNAWSYEHTEDIQAGVAQAAIAGLYENKKSVSEKIKLAIALQWSLDSFKTFCTGFALLITVLVVITGVIAGACSIDLNIYLKTSLIGSLSLLTLYKAFKPVYDNKVVQGTLAFFKLPDFTSDVGQLPIYQLQIKELSKLCLKEDEQRMLFVVDDLDRCSPEGIVKVLEAIRLVMDLEKVTVIIAIDHRIALSALALHYKDLEESGSDRTKYDIARDYLGKVIQLPINLDTPDKAMLNEYVDNLFNKHFVKEKRYENKVGTSPLKEDKPVHDTEQPINTAASTKQQHANNGSSSLNSYGDKKQTMHHSKKERDRFYELVNLFEFHNPRQLKRLHNSYRILRAYEQETEATNLRSLSMLFFLEFCHNQGANSNRNHESEFCECLEQDQDFDKHSCKIFKGFSKYISGKSVYLSTKKAVEPFVLPQAQRSGYVVKS